VPSGPSGEASSTNDSFVARHPGACYELVTSTEWSHRSSFPRQKQGGGGGGGTRQGPNDGRRSCPRCCACGRVVFPSLRSESVELQPILRTPAPELACFLSWNHQMQHRPSGPASICSSMQVLVPCRDDYGKAPSANGMTRPRSEVEKKPAHGFARVPWCSCTVRRIHVGIEDWLKGGGAMG
jgi:hypothetical protein